MRKIPTLFRRDPDNPRHVLPDITPGCEWVLDGEGIATRKYDGTCMLIRRDGLAVNVFARREVKPGKEPPPNFREVDHDPVTDKRVGWEPLDQTGWGKLVNEALGDPGADWMPGTYELCGPKVNGNPEGYPDHRLIRHADAQRYPLSDQALTFPVLRGIVCDLGARGWEGLVWHHPDGRMAKLKARDFA
jgi:hypothetical protein